MIPRGIRFSRRWRLWRSIIVVAVMGVMVGLASWYRVVFHSFAFWAQPTRISYCDRTYQTDGSVHGVDASRLADIGRLVPIIGWPLLAAGAARPSTAAHDAPCAMVLYLRVGTTGYVAYDLLGGP